MKSAEREHYGLAVSCAKRFQRRGVPMEELIAEGEAALLWAASRFDENRGVRFSTYAIPVVLGALRECCRRNTPMHVPRSERKVLSMAQEARERLRAEDGTEPSVQRIAEAIGVEEGMLGEMMAASDRMGSASGGIDPSLAQEEGFEERVLLRQSLRAVPSPFAQVVWMSAGLGMTQSEIARRMGVGQPQISRWEKKGIDLLRRIFREE